MMIDGLWWGLSKYTVIGDRYKSRRPANSSVILPIETAWNCTIETNRHGKTSVFTAIDIISIIVPFFYWLLQGSDPKQSVSTVNQPKGNVHFDAIDPWQ